MLKRWNKKEQKWMEAVKHKLSRRIVGFAQFHNADVVIEDLEDCRQTMKQNKKKNRSDAVVSRQSWAFYSLEQKLLYKLTLVELHLVKRPAPYTSKSCSTCGTLGNCHKHDFNCVHGHYHNVDLNAGRNLAQWDDYFLFSGAKESYFRNGFNRCREWAGKASARSSNTSPEMVT